MSTFGTLTLPSPTKTTDLVNDSRFMSIHDYDLNSASLSGRSSLTISDLPIGAIIARVEILVRTAFVSSLTQNSIEVLGADNSVLMDEDWNDPNVVGDYVSKCYYTITSNVLVNHDLSTMTAGSAILRLYVYDVS